ncbi:MAG: efflux RND transporter periplasmic adaptor subunit [Candidatus Blackburnbacteria bacterium]|nr:efflux RND transporter periplasmic adaptor subunit [Candidatus Blackburnbacteria bacterium]
MAATFTRPRKLFSRVKKSIGGKRLSVLLLIILILGWRFIATRPTEWRLETTEIQRGELVESISASGEVKADETANLSFQTSGQLTWVGVKEGDRVTQGQVIAKLDTVALSVAYRQALNNYRDKQALAEKAEDDVKGHEADETFAQKATRTTAQVARDNAYDSVRAAEHALRLATITSPFGGLVTEANPAYWGVNITPGTANYTIVNPDTVYFSAEVNEVDVTKVSPEQKVLVRLDAYPNEVFDSAVGQVAFQSTTTSTGATAYEVRVSLPKNTNFRFKVGMNGDAEFTLETKEDVLLLPATAAIEEKNQTYIWVVDSNNRAQKVAVKTGSSSVNNIEITSSLSAGAKVVTRPPAGIKSGDVVVGTKR